MTTSDDETKWLPFTVSVSPCCTSARVIVLGESEPISGVGLALLHKGFRVLLPQPGRNKRASRAARDRPQVREGMEILLLDESPPFRLSNGFAYKHPNPGPNSRL